MTTQNTIDLKKKKNCHYLSLQIQGLNEKIKSCLFFNLHFLLMPNEFNIIIRYYHTLMRFTYCLVESFEVT